MNPRLPDLRAELPQQGAAPTAGTDEALLSVVVPVRNEAANVAPLLAEIAAALRGVAHEVVYVDDGSADATPDLLAEAAARGALRWARHRDSCGQSAAVITGVRMARGAWIATLDGDGQNDPADIPALLARARAETARPGAAALMIAGHRVQRRDVVLKRLSSRAANAIRAWVLQDATPDTGCGLKVFRRDLFLSLPQFDHMHRFLPALVQRAGGRTLPLPVNHRPRVQGRSNYGTLDRLWVGVFDLMGMFWLQRRWRIPVTETRPEDDG